MAAAVLILISLYAPLNILGFAYREIRQSFIDMEEMMGVLRQSPQVADSAQARALDRPADARGASLAFDGVGFRHDARANGLEDVSFFAAPGTTTALVGPSGAGKSTVVKLALRLLDPQAEEITPEARRAISIRLIAQFSTVIAAINRAQEGQEIIAPRADLTHAGNYLYMLTGKEPTPEQARLFDIALVLHADHGMNASTFTAIATSSRSSTNSGGNI